MNINIPNNYDKISIEELKIINIKDEIKKICYGEGSDYYYVICKDDIGITTKFPIDKIDLLLELFENNKLRKSSNQCYILKTLKKYLLVKRKIDDIKYKKDDFNISNKELLDLSSVKHNLFASITLKDKFNYINGLHEELLDNLKDFKYDVKQVSLIMDTMHDISAMLGNLTNDFIIKKQYSHLEKTNRKNIEALLSHSISEIINTITKFIIENKFAAENLYIYSAAKLFKLGFITPHLMRVYFMYIDFLLYYNDIISNTDYIATEVINNFSQYKNYYERIFAKFNINKTVENIEDVFKGGLKTITDNIEIEEIARGVFLHDIGKCLDLTYFVKMQEESTERTERHLSNTYHVLSKGLKGVNMVLYTAAFHHEYYGLGYGLFNSMYEVKADNTTEKNIISYDLKDVLDCNCLSYFPAKMLEIVDVYDSTLYPTMLNQIYKGKNISGTLSIMHDEYINKKTKLDPILFDIFLGYMGNLVHKDFSAHKISSENTILDK